MVRAMKILGNKRWRPLFIIIGYLMLVMIRGCSIYMRANRPVYRDVRVAQQGATRTMVVSQLGLPEQSTQKDGKRVDIYKLDPNAETHGTKVAMTSLHFIADAMTLGAWEIVGTPIELATKHDLVTYEITYSADDKVDSVRTYEPSAPPQEQKPA
jgi:hypothetical protein